MILKSTVKNKAEEHIDRIFKDHADVRRRLKDPKLLDVFVKKLHYACNSVDVWTVSKGIPFNANQMNAFIKDNVYTYARIILNHSLKSMDKFDAILTGKNEG